MPIFELDPPIPSVPRERVYYDFDIGYPKSVVEYRSTQEAADDPDASDFAVEMVSAFFRERPYTVLVLINPEIVREQWKSKQDGPL